MKTAIRLGLVLCILSLFSFSALAGHSWGNYHWPRSTNPVSLSLGDNVDSRWDSYLTMAESDWEQSAVLTLQVIPGSTSTKRCNPDTGEVEVCNDRYGRTGWLGVAGIWASGDHITKAYTKVNDTYFDTAKYNTFSWRALVMCQEIGHDFGLDHQDENFNNPNLGTCMDYSNIPEGNEHPNAHDYDQLETLYGHADASFFPYDSLAARMSRPPTVNEILSDAGQWGAPIDFDAKGQPILFELVTAKHEDGTIDRVFTHVFWAPFRIEDERIENPEWEPMP